MVTLLGRRAAMLGATPSGGDRIVRTIRMVFDELAHPIPADAIDALSLAGLEGYVSGRDELQADLSESRAADSIVTVRLAPGLLALRIYGCFDAETIAASVDEFARRLHREDARCAIVDISGLLAPTRRRAAAVLGADESARMLGAHCLFAGGNTGWADAFEEAGSDPKLVAIFPSYADALVVGFEHVGLRLSTPMLERARRLVRGR